MFSLGLLRKATQNKERAVEVGWLLKTDHARFIWQPPRPLKRPVSFTNSVHPKSVVFCPAVVDHNARLFEVACPLDLVLRVRVDGAADATLIDACGDRSTVVPRTLAQVAFIIPRNQWRSPDHPILQIKTPYIFISDETVYMSQTPPFLHYMEPAWPGIVIAGRMPIHIWPRPLTWAFEWHDTNKELVLRRGDPWFYTKFEMGDASRHVRLVEAQLTQELKDYLAGTSGVVNYVNHTFSLFSTAKQRRPERLLVKCRRPSTNENDSSPES